MILTRRNYKIQKGKDNRSKKKMDQLQDHARVLKGQSQQKYGLIITKTHEKFNRTITAKIWIDYKNARDVTG